MLNLKGKYLTIFSIVCISLLCILPAVSGIKIFGAIYDHSLDPIVKTVVTINTTPEQVMVSNYGGYHFIVEPGTYLIRAELTQNGITREIASEIITVERTGEYARDLFMYPDFDARTEFEYKWYEQAKTFILNHLIYISVITMLLIIVITLYYKRSKTKTELRKQQTQIKRQKKQLKTAAKVDSAKSIPPRVLELKTHKELSDAAIKEKILVILQTQENITQKHIRSQFKLSEAKISLVLQEMEKEGTIKRNKVGRVNIIMKV